MRRVGSWAALALVPTMFRWAAGPVPSTRASDRPNDVVFVADGLRAGVVNVQTAPNLAAVRERGVAFANSHALFPTFTTSNASAMATGQYLGDTGDFSNTNQTVGGTKYFDAAGFSGRTLGLVPPATRAP